MQILMAPETDDLSSPYWSACREGRLELQRCRTCTRFVHHPERSCPWCGGADLGHDEVSGRGTIEAFTVIHRSFVAAYRDSGPYVVGWVGLDEQPGLRIFAGIDVEPDGETDLVGARVAVAFAEVAEFGAMPYFVLDGEATDGVRP